MAEFQFELLVDAKADYRKFMVRADTAQSAAMVPELPSLGDEHPEKPGLFLHEISISPSPVEVMFDVFCNYRKQDEER